jgi:hypothetical protein
MGEHALDGEMGLAGIGRPEDRDEPRSGAEHGHALKVLGESAVSARANPCCDAAPGPIEFAGPD